MSPSLFDNKEEKEDSQFVLYSDDPVTIKKNYKQLISLFHPDKSSENEIQQRLVDKIQRASDLADPMENKMYKFGVQKEYQSLKNQPPPDDVLILKREMTSVYDILERIRENAVLSELNEFNVQDSWPMMAEVTVGAKAGRSFFWNRLGTSLTWQYSQNNYGIYVSPTIQMEFYDPSSIQRAMLRIKNELKDVNFIFADPHYLVHTPSKVAILPSHKVNYSLPLGIKTSFKGMKLNLQTSLFKSNIKLTIDQPTRFAQMQTYFNWEPSNSQVGLSFFRPFKGKIWNFGLTLVSSFQTVILDDDIEQELQSKEHIDAQEDVHADETQVDQEQLPLEVEVESVISIMPIVNIGFYPEKDGLGVNINNQNITSNYTYPISDWAKMRVFASFGSFTEYGWRISMNITQLFRVTIGIQGNPSFGTAVMAGFKYYNQKLSLPIMLFGHPNFNLFLMSSVALFSSYGVIHSWLLKSFFARKQLEKLEFKKEEYAVEMKKKEEEALFAIERMQHNARKNMEFESENNGLIILQSSYGTHESSCDVTIPLQYFVKNSALELPAISKVFSCLYRVNL
eukprot:NODE_62_length_26495_cov_0.832853.p3 type:complete len:567 gc:universal NODE_62_length_26495_cov_0.832853:14930-13230(-)